MAERKWTQEQKAAIYAARGRLTAKEIGAILGTSRNVPLNIWNAQDRKVRDVQPAPLPAPLAVRDNPAVDVTEARRMRWAGATLAEIASRFGVNTSAVYRHVHDVICPVERRGRPRKAA